MDARSGDLNEEALSTDADRAPKFVRKLFEMVSDPNLDEHICWTLHGDAIQIVRPSSFARDVLPLYFKHSNLRSFIRQLNMYGFRRRGKGSRVIEFYHRRFQRGNAKDIANISRNHVSPELGPSGDLDPVAFSQLQQAQHKIGAQIEEVTYRLTHVEQTINAKLMPLASAVERLSFAMNRIDPGMGQQHGGGMGGYGGWNPNSITPGCGCGGLHMGGWCGGGGDSMMALQGGQGGPGQGGMGSLGPRGMMHQHMLGSSFDGGGQGGRFLHGDDSQWGGGGGGGGGGGECCPPGGAHVVEGILLNNGAGACSRCGCGGGGGSGGGGSVVSALPLSAGGPPSGRMCGRPAL